MRRLCSWALLLLLSLGILVQGCGVFTTYQSARVLPPGHAAPGLEVGLGATPAAAGWKPLMLDLGPVVRVGLGKDIDLGVRPTLLYADVKYQFRKGPWSAAFDFGVSYLPPANAGWDYPNIFEDLGLYPALLFSSGPWTYGARVIYLRQVEDGHATTFLMPGVVAGLSIGRRFRFVPGIGLYFCSTSEPGDALPLAFGLGFGFEYELGRQTAPPASKDQ